MANVRATDFQQQFNLRVRDGKRRCCQLDTRAVKNTNIAPVYLINIRLGAVQDRRLMLGNKDRLEGAQLTQDSPNLVIRHVLKNLPNESHVASGQRVAGDIHLQEVYAIITEPKVVILD